jgi:hypothetical protein
VQPVLKGGDHPEVAPTTPQPPEQLGLGVGVHPQPVPVGGHQVHRQQVVHGQAMLAHQVAQPTTQSQPTDPGVADDPGRDGQPEPLGGPVQLAQQDAAGGPGDAGRRVDPDRLHQRQVDHQPAVHHRVPGHGMAAAPHRHRQVVFAGEADRLEDIVGPGAAGDQGRPAVDGAVPDPPGLLVALLPGPQQRPPESGRDRCGQVGHRLFPCSSGAGGRRLDTGR